MQLAARLREHRAEIEDAMLARLHAVADPDEVEDPEYAIGLREAAGVALEYAVAGIEAGDPGYAPVPDRLRAQARSAARNGVSLDTVLRRYSAGYSLLDNYLIHAALEATVFSDQLKTALRGLSEIFDRLIDVVSTEYVHEDERHMRTAAHRRAEHVGRLLRGEPVEPEELNYRLDAWHLATIALGLGAASSMRELAADLDRRLLLVHSGRNEVWAWFGGSSRLSGHRLLCLAKQSLPGEVSIAVGEAGERTSGWRLSHRQARAATAVLRRGLQSQVCYADVVMLASALRDEVLASSLREIYLAPLEGERDGGAALRETLEAYFKTGQNASSAAAALGISRNTVSLRLRTIEEKIGWPVESRAGELETALRLHDLGHPVT